MRSEHVVVMKRFLVLLIVIASLVTTASALTYTSEYPPAYSDSYVKATSSYGSTYDAWLTTDPSLSLTGHWAGNQWVSPGTTSQRFHIDLGEEKIIRRIYYQNNHVSGSSTTSGAKNFTIWGSNEATSFAELSYSVDTDWVEITPSQLFLDEHIALDQSDAKYITLENSASYRYYAFKFVNNWGGGEMGVRRIELQTEDGYGATPPRSIISTITHDFGSAISYVLVTLTIPNEISSVSNLTSTTFDLTITNATTGLAGTNQTIYWCVG
jgi:hypothetical protein